MRIIKILTLITLMALITGCSCTAKRVDSNVPISSSSPLLDVNFAFDKYDLDSTATSKLKSNVMWLEDNSDATVVVEGHCDERGTNEYNMALGLKRARAVYDYYVSMGVNSGRLNIVSYGEELPLDPASNEAAWSRNRRAHSSVQ